MTTTREVTVQICANTLATGFMFGTLLLIRHIGDFQSAILAGLAILIIRIPKDKP